MGARTAQLPVSGMNPNWMKFSRGKGEAMMVDGMIEERLT